MHMIEPADGADRRARRAPASGSAGSAAPAPAGATTCTSRSATAAAARPRPRDPMPLLREWRSLPTAAASRVSRTWIAAVSSSAPMDRIRNFSIIAHIDHGKSTLADRILELTGAVDARKHMPQLLDSMDLERERGITIKAQAVRVDYAADDGETYHLHLIDTPGPRRLLLRGLAQPRRLRGGAAGRRRRPGRRGADRRQHLRGGRGRARADPGPQQGRPARRRAGAGRRRDRRPDRRRSRRRPADLGEDRRGRRARCSRRSSRGSRRPRASPTAPPRALIFDSEFDQYRGVVAYVRMIDGAFRKGEPIVAMQTGTEAEIDEIGFFAPADAAGRRDGGRRGRLRDHRAQGRLEAAGRRHADRRESVRPPRRCPATARSSRWSSAASSRSTPTATRTCATRSSAWRSTTPRSRYEPETSQALGFGFRCGFLGLLHMDIVRERLEREYDLELLATTPNVQLRGHAHQRRDDRGPLAGRDARPGRDRGDPRALHPRLGDLPDRATSAR